MKSSVQVLCSLFVCALMSACGGAIDASEELGVEQSPIRNGATPTTGFANIARIQITAPNGAQSVCSGTLVSSTRVLTAGHCIVPGASYSLSIGGNTRSGTNPRVHPWFSGARRRFLDPLVPGGSTGVGEGYDLATLDLTVALTTVAPRPVSAWSRPTTGEVYTIAGFGQTSTGSLPVGVRTGTATGVALLPGVRTLNGQVVQFARATHLIVTPGAGSTIACAGDSGSPLIDSSGDVVGVFSTFVTSGGSACNAVLNNGYVSTYDVRNWILRTATESFPFHNYTLSLDVDSDGVVGPLDALLVVNAINAGTGLSGGTPALRDVDRDGTLTLFDYLRVVNATNRTQSTSFTIQ